jgi:hypothetical protein
MCQDGVRGDFFLRVSRRIRIWQANRLLIDPSLQIRGFFAQARAIIKPVNAVAAPLADYGIMKRPRPRPSRLPADLH